MATPRIPAEIVGGTALDIISRNAEVIDRGGSKVTEYVIKGAEIALELCEKHYIHIALLTDKSPPCGSTTIDNGQFQRQTITGAGATTALLDQNGLKVYNQYSIEQANQALINSDTTAT